MIALPQVALYGGSFDPVHNAHLHILRTVSQVLRPDSLVVIPCHQPPHKTGLVASDAERLDMLGLALKELDELTVQVDEREMQREGLSYTYDTVSEYRRELGDNVSLVFVIGEDSWLDFTSWHRWREILSKVNLLVLKRPDIAQQPGLRASHQELLEYGKENEVLAQELGFFPAGKIAALNNEELAISSQAIRRDLANGGDFYSKVPPSVAAYLVEHCLYRP